MGKDAAIVVIAASGEFGIVGRRSVDGNTVDFEPTVGWHSEGIVEPDDRIDTNTIDETLPGFSRHHGNDGQIVAEILECEEERHGNREAAILVPGSIIGIPMNRGIVVLVVVARADADFNGLEARRINGLREVVLNIRIDTRGQAIEPQNAILRGCGGRCILVIGHPTFEVSGIREEPFEDIIAHDGPLVERRIGRNRRFQANGRIRDRIQIPEANRAGREAH